MQTIVTLTLSPTLDKSTSVDRIFPEQKMRCASPAVEAGGGGINVSKALRNLGGDSVAVFPAGGPQGMMLRDMLTAGGVPCKVLETEQGTRESFIVVETTTNHQYRFGVPGAALREAEGLRCLEMIGNLSPRPGYLVASGSLPSGLPDDFYAHAARLARQLDAKFILDTSGEPLKLAVNEGVYLLKPNLGELSSLAGMESLEFDQVGEVARDVLNRSRCEVIVVSLGPSGALLVTRDGDELVPAPTVRKRSTVGAGDSMVAGMTYSLARGKTLREAVRYGVACGTAATMTPGTELCHRQDVDRLYAWINNPRRPIEPSRAGVHTR